jgi:hypothetical protein
MPLPIQRNRAPAEAAAALRAQLGRPGHSLDTLRIAPRAAEPSPARLPGGLKAGVERRAGLSLDDVRVHFNSPKPATVRASAYTQGTDIFVGPGQERQLRHEAWHVVQQKRGRVSPRFSLGGAPINADSDLEREASSPALQDAAGESALLDGGAVRQSVATASAGPGVIQRSFLLNGKPYADEASVTSDETLKGALEENGLLDKAIALARSTTTHEKFKNEFGLVGFLYKWAGEPEKSEKGEKGEKGEEGEELGPAPIDTYIDTPPAEISKGAAKYTDGPNWGHLFQKHGAQMLEPATKAQFLDGWKTKIGKQRLTTVGLAAVAKMLVAGATLEELSTAFSTSATESAPSFSSTSSTSSSSSSSRKKKAPTRGRGGGSSSSSTRKTKLPSRTLSEREEAQELARIVPGWPSRAQLRAASEVLDGICGVWLNIERARQLLTKLFLSQYKSWDKGLLELAVPPELGVAMDFRGQTAPCARIFYYFNNRGGYVTAFPTNQTEVKNPEVSSDVEAEETPESSIAETSITEMEPSVSSASTTVAEERKEKRTEDEDEEV